jgi:hypothetical protein
MEMINSNVIVLIFTFRLLADRGLDLFKPINEFVE